MQRFLGRVLLFIPLGAPGLSSLQEILGLPGVPSNALRESLGWLQPPLPYKPGGALLVTDTPGHPEQPQPAGLSAELSTGALSQAGPACSLPVLCPDNRSVQLCLQEIIWRHQTGVWEEIPALAWVYIRSGGGCVFFYLQTC